MNKLVVIGTIMLVAILTFAITYAISSYLFDQKGTVIPSGQVTLYLDSIAWTGSDITWGTLTPGTTYQKDLNVTNNSNQAVTVTLTSTLPNSAWTQTWTLNNTLVAAFTNQTAWLTLSVPSDATAGEVIIPSKITINP